VPGAFASIGAFDAPANNSTVAQPFVLSGWAIDFGWPVSHSGVDQVTAYVCPVACNGSNAIWLPQPTYGIARPDELVASRVLGAGFRVGAKAPARSIRRSARSTRHPAPSTLIQWLGAPHGRVVRLGDRHGRHPGDSSARVGAGGELVDHARREPAGRDRRVWTCGLVSCVSAMPEVSGKVNVERCARGILDGNIFQAGSLHTLSCVWLRS
jgi:hypothetical protein